MTIGKGIKISAGFDLNTSAPLDNRVVFRTEAEMNALPAINKYDGLLSYVETTDKYYKCKDGRFEEFSVTMMTFQTDAEFKAFDTSELLSSIECFVVETASNYMYIGNGNWRASSNQAVFIGGEAPLDLNAMWINNEDEDVDTTISSNILDEFRGAISNMKKLTMLLSMR